MRIGHARRQVSIPPLASALTQRLPPNWAYAVLLWIAVVVAGGGRIIFESLGSPPSLDRSWISAPALRPWWPLGFTTLACLAIALPCRRFRPAATLPATFAMGGGILLCGAFGAGAVRSLAVTVVLFGLFWLVGTAALQRVWERAPVPIVQLPIAIGLGSGLVGLILLLLVSLGRLSGASVVASTGVLVLVLWVFNRRHVAWDAALPPWRPTAPTWFETVVVGLTVGLAAYAILAAFTPEVHSDAIRHHLPIAREIWQTGSAPEFVPMSTSRYPVHAHLLYAVAYGFGGMTAAKLVHGFIGLAAIVGIAGIGWLCAGRTAAIVGAALFATLPLVLWELGLSLVDLFPVLSVVAAALCVLLWQRGGDRLLLVCAGALAGIGFAAKMTAGVMIVALALGIFLVGRRSWRWGERLGAALAFSLGCTVVIPWIVRSYDITGMIPGASILVAHVSGTATSDLPSFGLGRSPLDLLRIPWEMTFHGEIFHQEGAGDSGIMLLMLLPLALFAPRTRGVAFLAATLVFSYAGWAFTAQLTRYLLPTIAIAAALAGIGVASVIAAPASRGRRHLALAVQTIVVLGLLAAPVMLSNGKRLGLPVNAGILTGRESSASFVDRAIDAAPALAAATAMLPPDTQVGYFGKWEGAQIYTEARLTYFGNPLGTSTEGYSAELAQLGANPDEVLANLDRLGIRYFIWERSSGKPEQWRTTVLSTEFLRHHTRILAGSRDSYLFEVLPDAGQTWTSSGQNLLQSPGLDDIGEDTPWITRKRVKHRQGVVTLRAQGGVAQRVAARGGAPYVLLVTTRCEEPSGRAALAFRWFDERDTEIELTTEDVVPGTAWGEQFLWHIAPENAASVVVELAADAGSQCDFDAAELYGPS